MAFPSLLVWAVSSPAMAYVYYAVLKLPRGFLRLLAALPLIAFYVSVAKGFDTVFERALYSFFFIWLTSFKIALLCWDAGPAADPWAVASFPRFLAVMTLSLQIKRQTFGDRISEKMKKRLGAPQAADLMSGSRTSVVDARDRESCSGTRRRGPDFSIKGNGRATAASVSETSSSSDSQEQGWIALLKSADESQEMHTVVLRLLFKFVLIMAMTYAFAFRASMSVELRSLLFSFYIYITCSLIFEGIAAVVSPLMGIELEPSFNRPFLAHSLADFWGQRWNLLVSNLLRVSIYDPMLRLLQGSEGSEPYGPCQSPALAPTSTPPETKASAAPCATRPLWARSVSMFSCFLVSGLMHELIFHNMTRSKSSWEVTVFFVLNGAATVLEGALRRKTSLRLPSYFSAPVTLTFVLVTAIWFFYPPLVDSGTADVAIAEFQYFFQTLYHLVGVS